VLHVIAILSLLIIALLTLLIDRVATVALTVTGMSRAAAQFQVRSALTGVGFTTAESEQVMNHPVRRRLVQRLIFLGPIGVIAGSGALIAALTTAADVREMTNRLAILAVGLLLLVWAAHSRWVDRRLTRLIGWLVRRTTDLDERDYVGMLRLAGEYQVAELVIEPGDWLVRRTLAEADLAHEGILVLGIVRGTGDYLGAPTGGTRIREGDILLLYGRDAVVRDLDRRRAGTEGDRAHAEFVAENRRVISDEQRRDAIA
jgi:hypothetical protein